MSSLPYEILVPIFYNLEKEDLLRCQLICKQWHTASLVPLYSDVKLHTPNHAFLYLRTVLDSRKLGTYLKSVFFTYVFGGIEFDKHGILPAIIQCCPNITKIENLDREPQFWNQLIYEKEYGQLSRLEILPESNSKCLDFYIYTALSFKNTLTRLYLSDIGPPYEYHLSNSLAFQILCNEIDDFKNLQSLEISARYDKHLSYLDKFIDRCQKLKEITYHVYIEEEEEDPNEPETIVLSRPDIRMLDCNWEQVNTKRRLEYIARKFPCLQNLTVMANDADFVCSDIVIIRLLQYAMPIPNFEISISVAKEDVLNIWAEFIKVKKGCKNVTIGNYPRFDESSNFYYYINLDAVRGLTLSFPLNIYINEVPHIWFFSNVGRSIRSLTIDGPEETLLINGESRITLHWFFNILNMCPFMEGLTIYNTQFSSRNLDTSKYPSIRKLTVNGIDYAKRNNFLTQVSFNLPNLRQLFVKFNYALPINMSRITIHLPHTSLDLLVWDEISCNHFKGGGDFLIKLDTDTGLRYYEGNKQILNLVNSTYYLISSTLIRFDIRCKNLKRLEISKTNFSFDFLNE